MLMPYDHDGWRNTSILSIQFRRWTVFFNRIQVAISHKLTVAIAYSLLGSRVVPLYDEYSNRECKVVGQCIKDESGFTAFNVAT